MVILFNIIYVDIARSCPLFLIARLILYDFYNHPGSMINKNYLAAIILLLASSNVMATGDGIPTSAAFIYLVLALYVSIPLIIFVLINWLIFKFMGKRSGIIFLFVSMTVLISICFILYRQILSMSFF